MGESLNVAFKAPFMNGDGVGPIVSPQDVKLDDPGAIFSLPSGYRRAPTRFSEASEWLIPTNGP